LLAAVWTLPISGIQQKVIHGSQEYSKLREW